MRTFQQYLENINSPLSRLISYCEWAKREFNFDGYHLKRGKGGTTVPEGTLIISFYRDREKPSYGFKGLMYAQLGESLEKVSHFFQEAGYECEVTANSLGGATITISNV